MKKKKKKKKKNIVKNFKTMYKNGLKSYKVWWYWNWKSKFHQYKIPIAIENTNVNEIEVSNKISFDKNDFKYFISYKDVKS